MTHRVWSFSAVWPGCHKWRGCSSCISQLQSTLLHWEGSTSAVLLPAAPQCLPQILGCLWPVKESGREMDGTAFLFAFSATAGHQWPEIVIFTCVLDILYSTSKTDAVLYYLEYMALNHTGLLGPGQFSWVSFPF